MLRRLVVEPKGNLAGSDDVAVAEAGHGRPADALPGKDPRLDDESSDS